MKEALNLLGLARRAGRLAAGRQAVRRNINRGKLLILAEDLSAREKERWHSEGKKYGFKVLEFSKKDELGRALGMRPVGILLLMDRGFARKMEVLLGEENLQKDSSR
ncbi:MAG: ribosomal L7Ae/L30e/S12e/Gadd45 family protein [Candidatus Hydrothermae bacterium]|uniref:50S ribosomal protein L7ae n=1 Tax=candidate division WOR-3 bacterium TaxID=2052148 RepID=A0A7C0XAK8_UNCW3|nr:ribosomal L7Ae/L30e/S12e/Gadd45 family protein [Candidatus Hydrothermae bacterium]RKY96905.1 MAG: 50S ribosomal protein L7ae [Candidatus Hydrothermae bacterium]RKZ03635.1 MAG: 50S ribosomal protein L7ae [Candidatus Hydrothermae bacterium]HDM89867.1 50S ribosomal protein L7ae [candidate division WOR-3 bacterium]